ncbi:MAG: zinc-ribbon domain-containing protein [Mariprofundus sp.]|nr:zinc-ribbon domain-containing protein [Mariprofundus sp.]
MEFIQCPHCQKKYAISDQLRAAVGKKIRCKHCSEVFDINIQMASKKPAPSPAASPVAEQEPQIKAAQAKKKKLNIQLMITIVLLIILMAVAIGAYLFFNKDSLFGTSPEQDTQRIIPQELIKPVAIKLSSPVNDHAVKKVEQKKAVTLAQHKPAALPASAAVKSQTIPEPAVPVDKQASQPSQVCKDISADYWVRSHRLATTSMDTATYMKLLDQNLEQADEIRQRCKQKGLISKIAKASRTNQKPAWIAQEISSRIESNQTQTNQQE